MKHGLKMELIELLEWVRDEFHHGGKLNAAMCVDDMLSRLEQSTFDDASRNPSPARLLKYVELLLRLLELWRNW